MQDNYILTWPKSADNLRETLHVSCGAHLTCHGITQKKVACKRKISGANGVNIAKLLDDVVAAGNLAAARKLLEKLSQLVICGKPHEAQGHALLRKWEQAFEKAEQCHRVEDAAEQTTSITVDVDVKQAASVQLQVNVRQTASIKLEVNVKSAPASPRMPSQRVIKSESYIKSDTEAEISLSSIPAITSDTQDEPSPIHTFVPYGKPRTQQQINKAIKDMLRKPLSPPEIKSLAENGVVYIYTFTDALHSQKRPHLKIGYTADCITRMKQWERRCGYKPGKMLQMDASLYIRVERLVHEQLWPHRRREDRCPGCGGAHKEFFDVRLSEAARVIALWADWMRQKPYDEDGELKREWRDKLQEVDLEEADCWDDFTSSE